MRSWWRSITPTQRAAFAVGSFWTVLALIALVSSGATGSLVSQNTVLGVHVDAVQGVVHLILAAVLVWSAFAGPSAAEAANVLVAAAFACLVPVGIVAIRSGFNPMAVDLWIVVLQLMTAVLLADVALARWLAARRDAVVPAGTIAPSVVPATAAAGAFVSLDALTKTELLELARELDVRGRSKMRKPDLVRAIARAA
jgi:hypothetical protein